MDVGNIAKIGGEVALNNGAKIGSISTRALVDGVIAARVGLEGVVGGQCDVVANELLAGERGSADGTTRAVTTARSACTTIVRCAKIRNRFDQGIIDVGSRGT